MPFWDEVRSRWDSSVSAVVGNELRSSTRIRQALPFSLLNAKVPIAMTGRPGAGKSICYEALVGRINSHYTPPGKSRDSEPHRIVVRGGKRKFRAQLVVVPGQKSQEREDALDSMTSGSSAPTGLVHVVCYGHNKAWHSGDRAIVNTATTPGSAVLTSETVRQRDLDHEVADFAEVCERLRHAWNKRTGVWLVVAVAKCDLYWSRVAEAGEHYLPGSSDSPFAEVLRELVGHVGIGNFAGLAVLPVSSYLDGHDFDASLPRVSPQLDQRQSAALVDRFRSTIGEFGGQR